jgi:predicted methyltransferase
MRTLLSYILVLICCAPGVASSESAADPGATGSVKLNLNHASRSDAEKARDRHRQPEETLAFFGLKENMRVIELFPGRGWYTKLLGPYLEQNGTLYVAIGTGDIEPKLVEYGLSKVVLTGIVENFTKTDSPGYIFSPDKIDLEQTDVDLVLTFRNAHNLTSESRLLLNKAAFDALKPGGIYGVVDHTKRHMEAFNAATWRRTDPVQIIKEAVSVGFEFIDYLNIHARPEDGLEFDSKHESLVNETDRYTLKFRKPKEG